MLGNENDPDQETETPNKDHSDRLSENFPDKEIFLDAAISAAISQTDDDILEKLIQVDDNVRERSRLHTPEDIEIAIAESVDRIVESRSSNRNSGMSPPVQKETLVHGYTERGLEILAACKDIDVPSLIDQLNESADRPKDDPIVQSIKDRNYVRIGRWLDEHEHRKSAVNLAESCDRQSR